MHGIAHALHDYTPSTWMQITTLPNGLRVATESIPFAETTTIGVWINSGSRFETDANNGVAHFLEHILFKGTKVRADASHHGHIMQVHCTVLMRSPDNVEAYG